MQQKHGIPFFLIILFLCASIFMIGSYHSSLSPEVNPLGEDKNTICASSITPIKQWNTTWGGSSNDMGNDVAKDSLGNLYVCGDTQSFGSASNSIALVKFAPNGTKLWNTTWGPSMNNYGNGVAVDSDGNIYACGHRTMSAGTNYDITVVKFASNGTELWNTTWGGASDDMSYDIVSDPSENLYVCGSTFSYSAVGLDVVLVKFASNGTKLWNFTWGGSGFDYSRAIAIDFSGNLYICGFTDSFGVVGSAVALVKFAPNGTKLWNVTWDTLDWDTGVGVTVDSAGNIYVTGSVSPGMTSTLFVVKFDSTGDQKWNTTLGGTFNGGGNGILVDSSGNLYVCGNQIISLISDLFIAKYDSNGNQLWTTSWGGSDNDVGTSLILDSSDNLYICGNTQSFGAGGPDFLLIKFDVGETTENGPIPGFQLLLVMIGLVSLIIICLNRISFGKLNQRFQLPL